jgi:hypothetical protein
MQLDVYLHRLAVLVLRLYEDYAASPEVLGGCVAPMTPNELKETADLFFGEQFLYRDLA